MPPRRFHFVPDAGSFRIRPRLRKHPFHQFFPIRQGIWGTGRTSEEDAPRKKMPVSASIATRKTNLTPTGLDSLEPRPWMSACKPP
jgi:hypothetical protein